jgi:hypothetical protein
VGIEWLVGARARLGLPFSVRSKKAGPRAKYGPVCLC